MPPHPSSTFSAPTVLVDRGRVENNVLAMLRRAEAAQVALRPHFKTHQSVDVGAWMRALGVERITVSSAAMAEGFVAAGWNDLTIALPLYPSMLPRVAALLDRAQVGLLVDHPEAARALLAAQPLWQAAAQHGRTVPIWIKLDAGYGRAGVRWDDRPRMEEVVEILAGGPAPLALQGLLLHSGHTYSVQGRDAVAAIHQQALERTLPLRALLEPATQGRPVQVSVGDTPTCSLLDDFGAVDEIRPGNFVFYDLDQVQIGSCEVEQIAACVLCPVIGKDEANGRLILHGGAVHLSKDRFEHRGGACFGWLAPEPYAGSWQVPDAKLAVRSLSQEHGIVPMPPATLARFAIGDFVQVFPVHSCLACDLHAQYQSTDGAALTRVR